MGVYECRHGEWHDDTEWHQVSAVDPAHAATVYAEYLDGQDSETWQDQDRDKHTFLVRMLGRTEHEAFVVSFDYCKSFRARREDRYATAKKTA